MCTAASHVIEQLCDREYNPNPGPLAPWPRKKIICDQREEQLEMRGVDHVKTQKGSMHAGASRKKSHVV